MAAVSCQCFVIMEGYADVRVVGTIGEKYINIPPISTKMMAKADNSPRRRIIDRHIRVSSFLQLTLSMSRPVTRGSMA